MPYTAKSTQISGIRRGRGKHIDIYLPRESKRKDEVETG